MDKTSVILCVVLGVLLGISFGYCVGIVQISINKIKSIKSDIESIEINKNMCEDLEEIKRLYDESVEYNKKCERRLDDVVKYYNLIREYYESNKENNLKKY